MSSRTKKKPTGRNKFEQKIIDELTDSGEAFTYEPYSLPYTISARYWPDLELANGVLIELKGYLRPEDRRKMVAVKQSHPGRIFRIVFQKANEKYIRWAEKNGFEWAEGAVPKEWHKR